MVLQFRLRLKCCIFILLVMSSLAQRQANQKVCGEILNEVLDMLCAKGFSKRLKRQSHSMPNIDGPEVPNSNLFKHTKLGQTLMKQNKGAEASRPNRLRRSNRTRRNVAHECCKNECTYDDIAAYCM